MYSPPPKFTTNIVVSTFTTNIVVSVAWNVAMACKQMIKHNKYRSCVSFLRQRGLLAHLILPHLLHGALPWHAHSNRKPLTTKIAAACLFACTPDWYCRICCMERSRGMHTENRKPLTTKIAAACLFACTPDWYCRICCMEPCRGMHTENHWLQKLQLRASLLAHLTDIAASVAWSVAVACTQKTIYYKNCSCVPLCLHTWLILPHLLHGA